MAGLGGEWARAASEATAALGVLCGGVNDVFPWNDLLKQLDFTTNLLILRMRLPANLLKFRANYSRAFAGWLLVCTIRHPFKSVCLLLVLTAWFHALLVRRGVLHIQVPFQSVAQLTGRHVVSSFSSKRYFCLCVCPCFCHDLHTCVKCTSWICCRPSWEGSCWPHWALQACSCCIFWVVFGILWA